MSPKVVRRQLELGGKSVPLVEMTGADDGPLLTVVAGVHGCEYASMAGVRRWLRALAGDGIAWPGARRAGAEPVRVRRAGRRSWCRKTARTSTGASPAIPRAAPPSGSRTTPTSSSSSARTRFIDAHCGDMVEALQPFALYEAGPAEDRARDIACAYGLPYVIRQVKGPDRAVAGTTSGAAAEAGIPAIYGRGRRLRPGRGGRVAMHVAGLHDVLRAAGDDHGRRPAASPAQTHLSRFIWLRCARAGWWAPAVGAGDRVAAGRSSAQSAAWTGRSCSRRSPRPSDGVIIFVTSSPAVADDGLLLGLGAS